MANITKQDLIYDIAHSTGFIQSDIREVVEQFLETIGDSLKQQKNIEIRGFGTFTTKKRRPRPARNPKTGEEVQLSERWAPLFKFSGNLKKRIDQMQFPATETISVDQGIEQLVEQN